MKKTLLAIAVAGLFGATAQATTVYDADGTTLDLGADIEVAYSKSTDNGSDAVMSVEDADIRATLTQVVKEGLSAFGKVELDADGTNSYTTDTDTTGTDSTSNDIDADSESTTTSSSDEAVLDTAIVGLTSDTMGTISFGKQVTIRDDAGIFNDYKLGANDVSVATMSSGNQVIKYKFSNDTFYAGVAYAMNVESNEDTDGEDSGYDGNLGYTGIENLELVVYAGSYDDASEDQTETYVQVQAVYTIDNLTLSGIAGSTDVEGDTGSGFGGQVAYTMDKATYSVGFTTVDNEDIDGDDQADYFAGVGYALSSNMTAYAQIGGNNADDSELGYAVGIDVGF